MSARRALDVATLVAAAPFLFVALLAYDVLLHLARWRGERAFYRAVAATARLYLAIFRVVFRMRFVVEGAVPDVVGRGPFLVVAIHQPPIDLLLATCIFMENAPAYVARAGLDRWCPTVRVFLRGTGSLVLKRGDRAGNTAALRALGARTQARGRGAIIFPEGRKPWGEEAPQPFHRAGLRALLEGAPDAVVIPVVFEDIARFLGAGRGLPRFGLTVRARVLAPIARAPGDAEAVIDACERTLTAAARARLVPAPAPRRARAPRPPRPSREVEPAWT